MSSTWTVRELGFGAECATISWEKLCAVAISLAMLADFVFRGLAIAFTPEKTDFTELYTSGWLWRHGLDFYNSALVTSTATRLTGSGEPIAPIYPPTTVAAVSPLTYLPWGWAHFIWLLLLFAGVLSTLWLLARLGNFTDRGDIWALFTVVFAFGPLHQAFHLANIALLIVPLCFLGIEFAERKQDISAGVALSLAAVLKPQLGIWVLAFYAIQFRQKIIAGILAAVPFVFLLYGYPIPCRTLLESYRQNLQFWFAAGRPFGFTDGAFPFNVNFVQILLYQLWNSVTAVKILAHLVFLAGLATWLFAVRRTKFRVPVPLALSSLLGLSFVSLYHSVADATVLTLVLCWALKKENQTWSLAQKAVCAVFLLMLLPGHSILIRMAPHLSHAITTSWWWKFLIARYFVWLLLAFNGLLLHALLKLPKTEHAVLKNSQDAEPLATSGISATADVSALSPA